MKCSELKRLLERAITFRSSEPGLSDQRWGGDFFSILDSAPDQSVKNLAKAIGAVEPTGISDHSAIKDLCAFLDALASLLADHAKAATVQELRELEGALRRHSASDLSALADGLSNPKKKSKTSKPKATLPIRDEVVARYTRRLEEALGDDEGFNSVFATLESDHELSAGELAAIAKKFANSTTKARSAALKKIFARHQAIMVSRAKSAATAGRIAG